MHKNGHRYEIIGTAEPITLNPSQANGMMDHLDAICKKYGLQYRSENGNGSGGNSQVPIRDLFRDEFIVYEGHNRHLALLRAMESLIKRTAGILSLDKIKRDAREWNQEHCSPPLDDREFERQWKDATKFIVPTLEPPAQPEQQQQSEPQRLVELTEELTKEVSWDDVANVLETSVKKDWPAKVITFNAILLAQTNDDQFNIGYQAESAAGKSYIAIEIAKYFPQDEVMMIASASPTAFFHDSGKWDPDKKALIVDLKHKILIFLDMQGFQLLEKLRPILSHDKEELHYKITDKSQKHGLRTKNVIIRGPPTVIFCSAKMDPDEQEKTRMLLLSPSTDQQKLKESIEFAALSKSDREAHQKRLAQDNNRNWLIDRINALRQLGVREVVIPHEGKTVCDRFLAERKDHLVARHQRDFPRILSFIKSHSLLNGFKRDKLEGKDHTIIANEQDIEAGFELYKKIEESNELGLSPFVYRIYKEVIEPQLDSAIGLTRKQIRSKYYAVFHKTLTNKFEDSVLMQLESAGLIVQEPDPNDKRKLLIYPTHPEDIF